MLRALSSSFFSLLLLVTLMWGGCISCPQFFMFPKAAKKSCCDGTGKCNRQNRESPLKRECKRMPLEPASSEFHLTGFAAKLPEAPLQLVPEPDVFRYAWHE